VFTIPLTRPFINEAMKKAVASVLDSRMLTEGEATREFERAVREYVGVNYAVATNNCTTGLELALRAIGLQSGDEVIVPDFTYPATGLAPVLAGGVAVIADVDPETMLLTPELAERVRTSRTKAVMPVSAFGNPLDYDGWARWSSQTGVLVVEDAAPALGSAYHDAKVGSFSHLTIFSFHPRKSITTGEGGMVVTNNKEWFSYIQSYKHFGMLTHQDGTFSPPFCNIGTNFKMSNILAALGIEQLKILDKMVDKRRSLSLRYIDKLNKVKNIKFPLETKNGIHSYQTFCIFIDDRNNIMSNLRARGIEANIGTYNLHNEPFFQNNNMTKLLNIYPGSDYVGEKTLSLPLYHEMTNDIQNKVINEILSLI
jgi:dTDP-4-amino-4,6-dideoxygalactose transaminase